MGYVKEWRHAQKLQRKEWKEAVDVMLEHQLRWSKHEFRFYSGSEQINEFMAAHSRRMIDEFCQRGGFLMEAEMIAMEFYVNTRITASTS